MSSVNWVLKSGGKNGTGQWVRAVLHSQHLLMLLPTLAALEDGRSVSHGVHTLPPAPKELHHCLLEGLPHV